MICKFGYNERVQAGSTRITDADASRMLAQNPGFFQASITDSFQATAETIRYMCRLIDQSKNDVFVQAAAQDAVGRFAALCNTKTPGGKAEACWWWVKHAIKFVHHQRLFEKWGVGDGNELQLLISPDVLLRMQDPRGDCAVFTCLLCAMLDCLGVQWEIVTVAVDPKQPDVCSHVYPRAALDHGFTLPLDASHGKYPGWQVPRSRVTLKQVWNDSGAPVQDQDSGYRGLHGLSAPVAHPFISHFLQQHPQVTQRIEQRLQNRLNEVESMSEGLSGGPLEGGPLNGDSDDWMGLGQDDGSGDEPIDTGATPIDLSGMTYGPTDAQLGIQGPTDAQLGITTSPGGSLTLCPGGTYVAPGYQCPPAASTSSSSNTALANALSSFGAAWTKIAGQVIAPQVTETGPGGTSITGPASALQSILGSGVSIGGTNYSLLLILGLAIGGIFLISSLSKK